MNIEGVRFDLIQIFFSTNWNAYNCIGESQTRKPTYNIILGCNFVSSWLGVDWSIRVRHEKAYADRSGAGGLVLEAGQ